MAFLSTKLPREHEHRYAVGRNLMNGEADRSANQLQGLQTTAGREQALLAPYAMFSHDSVGRQYAEPDHPYRGPFQRDRDRILHSSAYRRLSGKMQVFTGEMGDYHRTRLTHTQEVASIARTIARTLQLNEDLVEALALFHDIGHPPFGHAGEDALNECLSDVGGFSHNQYALTIAEQLEYRHLQYPGLNLSQEVLNSQAFRVDKQLGSEAPLLEAQVVDAADSITYDAHDTDDAIKLGLVTMEEFKSLDLVRHCLDRIGQAAEGLDEDNLRRAIVHELIDCQVNNVLHVAGRVLMESGWESAAEAQQDPFLIEPAGALADEKKQLESFLLERVYHHPQLIEKRDIAQDRLQRMFDLLTSRVDMLPGRFQDRASEVGLKRAVGDYLAGMTDRYLENCFKQQFPAG